MRPFARKRAYTGSGPLVNVSTIMYCIGGQPRNGAASGALVPTLDHAARIGTRVDESEPALGERALRKQRESGAEQRRYPCDRPDVDQVGLLEGPRQEPSSHQPDVPRMALADVRDQPSEIPRIRDDAR